MRIAQLTDTHVVERGGLCHGLDTGAYLSAAIDALNAMRPAIDAAIVTGDLTDHGREAEYAHFAERASALTMPWFVIPGNHDHAGHLRAVLPPRSFGGIASGPISYAVDLGEVRLVGIDANRPGASPGAKLTRTQADWLDDALAASNLPTLVGIHHPPFSSGLWYLDMFGFAGARALRRLIDRHRHVGRIVAGHIHCVRSARWRHAIACSAPSSAPQFVPMFHHLDVVMQEPGFAVHDFDPKGAWSTTIFRRAASEFVPTQRL